jgi:nucleotide-binding universal stress UspA family protein
MFQKVMWATDGSDAADQALPLAKTLAADGGGKLLVAHCEELTMPGKAGGSFPVQANEDELKVKIERQVAELSQDGVPTTVQIMRSRVGGAAHAIADAAREGGTDVIVVGTRGHTALAGLLVGSVTQRLLHISPCPVLAVPSAVRDVHG